MNLTPEQSYRLAVVSNAPIQDTTQAKYKARWLLETALRVEEEIKEASQQPTPATEE